MRLYLIFSIHWRRQLFEKFKNVDCDVLLTFNRSFVHVVFGHIDQCWFFWISIWPTSLWDCLHSYFLCRYVMYRNPNPKFEIVNIPQVIVYCLKLQWNWISNRKINIKNKSIKFMNIMNMKNNLSTYLIDHYFYLKKIMALINIWNKTLQKY